MKYSNSFSHDLNFGNIAEDWINDLFSNGKLIEIKNDRIIQRTGNLFVEYESRNMPSGLATTTANYWIYRFNELDSALILPVILLKQVCRKYFIEKKFIKNGGDCDTSVGFLVPLKTLLNDIAKERKNL